MSVPPIEGSRTEMMVDGVSPGVEVVGGGLVGASPLRLVRGFGRGTSRAADFLGGVGGRKRRYVEAEWVRDRYGRWLRYIGTPVAELWKPGRVPGVEVPNFAYGTLLKSPLLGDRVVPGESRKSPFFARIASPKLADGSYVLEVADSVEKLGRVEGPDELLWEGLGSVLPVVAPEGSVFIRRKVGTGGTFVLATRGRAKLSRVERARRGSLGGGGSVDVVNAEEVDGFVPDVESGVARLTGDVDGPLGLGDPGLRRELAERAFSDEVFQEWLDTVEGLSGREWVAGDEGVAASMYEDYIFDEVSASLVDGLRERGVVPGEASGGDVDAVLTGYMDEMLPGLSDAFDVFDESGERAGVGEGDVGEGVGEDVVGEGDVGEGDVEWRDRGKGSPRDGRSGRRTPRWEVSPVTGEQKLITDWFPNPDIEQFPVVQQLALEREEQETALLDSPAAAAAREVLDGTGFALMDGLRDVNDPDDVELLWNVLEDITALEGVMDPSNDLPFVRSLVEEALTDAVSDDGRAALGAALERLSGVDGVDDIDAIDVGGAADAPLTRLTDVLVELDRGQLGLRSDAFNDQRLFDELLDDVAGVDLSRPDEMQAELERRLVAALDVVETDEGRRGLNDALQTARFGSESFFSDEELEAMDSEELARFRRQGDSLMLSVYERQRLEGLLAGEVRQLDAELDELWERDADGIAGAQKVLQGWVADQRSSGGGGGVDGMIAENLVSAFDRVPSDVPLRAVRNLMVQEVVDSLGFVADAVEGGRISDTQSTETVGVLSDMLQMLDRGRWSELFGESRGDLDALDIGDEVRGGVEAVGGRGGPVVPVVDDPVRASLLDWLAGSGASDETLQRVATARNAEQVVDAVMADDGLPAELFDEGVPGELFDEGVPGGGGSVGQRRAVVPEGGWEREDVPVPWMGDRSLREMGIDVAAAIGGRREMLQQVRDAFNRVADEVVGFVDGELVEDENGVPVFNDSLLRDERGGAWEYALEGNLFEDIDHTFNAYDGVLSLLGGLMLHSADPERYAELEAEAGPGNKVFSTIQSLLGEGDPDYFIDVLSKRLKNEEKDLFQDLNFLPKIFNDEAMSRIPVDLLGVDDGQRIIDGVDNFNADFASLLRDPKMLDRLNRLAGIDRGDGDADQRLLDLANEVFVDQGLTAVNRSMGDRGAPPRSREARQREAVEAGWDELFAAIAERGGVSPEELLGVVSVRGGTGADLAAARGVDEDIDAIDVPDDIDAMANPPRIGPGQIPQLPGGRPGPGAGGGRPAGVRPEKLPAAVARVLAEQGLLDLDEGGPLPEGDVKKFEAALARARRSNIEQYAAKPLGVQVAELLQLFSVPPNAVVRGEGKTREYVGDPFKRVNRNWLEGSAGDKVPPGLTNLQVIQIAFGGRNSNYTDAEMRKIRDRAISNLVHIAADFSKEALNFRSSDNGARNAEVGVRMQLDAADRAYAMIEKLLASHDANGRVRTRLANSREWPLVAPIRDRTALLNRVLKAQRAKVDPSGAAFEFGRDFGGKNNPTTYGQRLRALKKLQHAMRPGQVIREANINRLNTDTSFLSDFAKLEQDLGALIRQVEASGAAGIPDLGPDPDAIARRILSRLSYLAGTTGKDKVISEYAEGNAALSDMMEEMYRIYQEARGKKVTDTQWDTLSNAQLDAAASVLSMFAGKGTRAGLRMNSAMMALRDAAKRPAGSGGRFAALSRARWLLADAHLRDAVPVMHFLGVPVVPQYLRDGGNPHRELAARNLGPDRKLPRGGTRWSSADLRVLKDLAEDLRNEAIDDDGQLRDDAAARLRLKVSNLFSAAVNAYGKGDFGAFEAIMEIALSRLGQVGKGNMKKQLYDLRDSYWQRNGGKKPADWVAAGQQLTSGWKTAVPGFAFPTGPGVNPNGRSDMTVDEVTFFNGLALLYTGANAAAGSVDQRVKLASALWAFNQVDGRALEKMKVEHQAAMDASVKNLDEAILDATKRIADLNAKIKVARTRAEQVPLQNEKAKLQASVEQFNKEKKALQSSRLLKYPSNRQLQQMRNALSAWDPNGDVRSAEVLDALDVDALDALDVGSTVVPGISNQRVAESVRAARLVAGAPGGVMSGPELAMELGVPLSELGGVVDRLVGAGLLERLDLDGFQGFVLGGAGIVVDDLFPDGRQLNDAELVDEVVQLFPVVDDELTAAAVPVWWGPTDRRVAVVGGVPGSGSAEWGLVGSSGVPDPRVSARWDPVADEWVLVVSPVGGFRVFGDRPGLDGVVVRRYASLPDLVSELQVLASLNRLEFPVADLVVT